jgi:serine/threonine protein kinase
MRLSDGYTCDVMAQRVFDAGYSVVACGPDRRNAERMTALKSLHGSLLNRHTVFERFIDEGLRWAGLWPHPNVVRVYGVTTLGDGRRSQRPFIALEYAGQGSLRDWLARGQLTREAALAWAQCIAAGLSYLHEPDPIYLRMTPTLHGNLKPENVLIRTNGVAVLTDVGLARAVAEVARAEDLQPFIAANGAPTETQGLRTAAGVTLGAPAYLAPEQWIDPASAGPAADIYVLGVMLYEMVAGVHPLLDMRERHGQQTWRQAHEALAPQPLRALDLSLPEALEALALACLAKEADRRPGAREVWARLQEIAQSQGTLVWEPPEIVAHNLQNEQAFWCDWSNLCAYFERWEEALERNDRAMAIDPQVAPMLRARGDILVGLQRYGEAEVTYQEALQHANSDEERGKVWGQLGTMHNEAGHDALAVGDCRAVIARCKRADAAYARQMELAPQDPDASLNRAVNQRLWAMAERPA